MAEVAMLYVTRLEVTEEMVGLQAACFKLLSCIIVRNKRI